MRAFVLGVVVAVMSVCVSPAWGAFPGRDGDLVVATAGGLELVSPATGAASSICTSAVLCGQPTQPHFSPNGRAIAFVDTATHRPVVIAADGSCLWCLLGAPLTTLTGSEPAFVAGSRAVTLAGNGLWSVSLTGGKTRRLVKGVVGDAVWSSRGLVALVRVGWIWVGRPGRGTLRRLARGDSPSFSPDGARLAFARDGKVWIVAVRGGAERRLVSGSAPAWSPERREIAYISPGGAVEIIAVHGGRPHPVGAVHGSALDWQPLPASASGACRPPRGSKVLASSNDAIVYLLGENRLYGPHVYGCLKALDRAQLLPGSNVAYFSGFVAVRLAGRFVAVDAESEKAPGHVYYATMYDLSSGAATPVGSVGDLYGPTLLGLDSLALDSSGFAAWRETTTMPLPESITAVSCPSPSLCIAGDGSGDILSSTNPAGGKSAWSMTSISPTDGPTVTQISCPSTSLCLGLGDTLLNYTDPTGGTSAWAQSDIDPQNILGTLSCPSVSLCVATDVGDILTSTDPTGGPGDWAKTPIGQSTIAYGMSCPSVSLCVATATQGDILSSTNPTGGASAWATTPIDQGNDGVISCPSVSLCVAAAPEGTILTSTDPTGGASAWTATPIDQEHNEYVSAISCPSVTLCVATDGGTILTSTDPAGGVGVWSKASVDQGSAITSISCPSISLCVAGDQNGDILTSTDPTGGANAWNIAAVDTPPCASQSSQCTYDQLYVHDDQGTRAVDSAPLGDGNLIANVTLGGDSLTLSWTHGGAQRQLQLR
jgi:hypothetical protein